MSNVRESLLNPLPQLGSDALTLIAFTNLNTENLRTGWIVSFPRMDTTDELAITICRYGSVPILS